MREIRDLVDPEFWGYCNTKENPADIRRVKYDPPQVKSVFKSPGKIGLVEV